MEADPAPARQAALWHPARGFRACAQGGRSSAERRKRSAAILPRAQPLWYRGMLGCTGAWGSEGAPGPWRGLGRHHRSEEDFVGH